MGKGGKRRQLGAFPILTGMDVSGNLHRNIPAICRERSNLRSHVTAKVFRKYMAQNPEIVISGVKIQKFSPGCLCPPTILQKYFQNTSKDSSCDHKIFFARTSLLMSAFGLGVHNYLL